MEQGETTRLAGEYLLKVESVSIKWQQLSYKFCRRSERSRRRKESSQSAGARLPWQHPHAGWNWVKLAAAVKKKKTEKNAVSIQKTFPIFYLYFSLFEPLNFLFTLFPQISGYRMGGGVWLSLLRLLCLCMYFLILLFYFEQFVFFSIYLTQCFTFFLERWQCYKLDEWRFVSSCILYPGLDIPGWVERGRLRFSKGSF